MSENYEYQPVTICDDYTINGWVLKDQRWNGWDIPMFETSAMRKMVEELECLDRYDEETDTVYEKFDPNSHEKPEDVDRWKGRYNEELKKHVYAIGAWSWTWVAERSYALLDDPEMKQERETSELKKKIKGWEMRIEELLSSENVDVSSEVGDELSIISSEMVVASV